MFFRHTHVFAFARYTDNEIAIIAINFNEAPVIFQILIQTRTNFLNILFNYVKIINIY